MTRDELSNIINNLTNGDLIRIEFNSEQDARGAMEGRFMHTHDSDGEHIYLHFTDGVRVFYLDLFYAQLINSITVLEKWSGSNA